jgi:hypothetical protein
MRFIALALLLVLICAQSVSAWGFAGHSMISTAAAERLPAELPAFVRTPAAVDEIGALGPEADISKDAGEPHDADLDTGHYVDVDDAAKIDGVVDLDALPATRRDYDTALRQAGTNEYSQGYLPYSLMDGWEQVRKDFAIWRVDRVGETKAASAADRAFFAKSRALREMLTVHDIGYWSHFVGDASQPLHVTMHYNGWGKYPNPNGYTTEPIHSRFEGAFVADHATLAAVLAHMQPFAPCNCTIQQLVGAYLRATNSKVVPLYEIEKRGGFANGTPEAIEFVDARLGDGATMLRNMIVEAWTSSATVKVGYPHGITPKDAEDGTTIPSRRLYND